MAPWPLPPQILFIFVHLDNMLESSLSPLVHLRPIGCFLPFDEVVFHIVV